MYATLLCPLCGGHNTHQVSARVGFRRVEDEPASPIVHVTTHDIDGVSNPGSRAQRCTVQCRTLDGHIAGRRHEIQIDIECEHCGGGSTLTIQQHKGSTNLAWLDGSDLDLEY